MSIRADFPILQRSSRGRPLVYLDNAATSQKPAVVIDAVNDYYQTCNANVHRAAHELAEQATEAMENSRRAVRDFVNATREEEIVFTRGLLARAEAAGRAVVALFRSEGSQACAGAERCLVDLSRERRFASLNFAKVDVGASEGLGGLAKACGVAKTPAFLVFREGKVAHRSEGFLGAASAAQLARALQPFTRPLSARERLAGLAGDVREALADAGRAVVASPVVAAVVRRPLRAALGGLALGAAALVLRQGSGAVGALLRARRRAEVEARARARQEAGAGDEGGEEDLDEVLGPGGRAWRLERERLRKRDLVERFRAENRIRRDGWAAAKRAQTQDFARRTAAQLDRLERGASLAQVRRLELDEGAGLPLTAEALARRATERLEGVPGGILARDSARSAELGGSRAQARGAAGAAAAAAARGWGGEAAAESERGRGRGFGPRLGLGLGRGRGRGRARDGTIPPPPLPLLRGTAGGRLRPSRAPRCSGLRLRRTRGSWIAGGTGWGRSSTGSGSFRPARCGRGSGTWRG